VPAAYLKKVDDQAVAAGQKPVDTQNRRLYAAMTMWMDEAIGEVAAALRTRGMWNNTLVVFSSDNGGPIYEPGSANNHPLKGGKYTDWEGGVRVNAWLSGGFVPAEKRGTRFAGVMSIADWYGTLCELAGIDQADTAAEKANKWLKKRGLPLLPPVDSVPQWGFIMNGTNGRPSLHVSEQALLQYPYKLVTGSQTYSRWQGELYPNCSTVESASSDKGPVFQDLKIFDVNVQLAETAALQDEITWVEDCGAGCLFDVEADPTEHADLARDPKYAAVLGKLQQELQSLNRGVFRPVRGEPTVTACEASIDNGGYYGPFVASEGWYSPVPGRSPGEAQKDAMLREAIHAAANEVVQGGVVKIVQKLAPVIRKPWMSSLDKCFAPPPEEVIVV